MLGLSQRVKTENYIGRRKGERRDDEQVIVLTVREDWSKLS